MITYTENNYIEFIKTNITCLIQQKEVTNIDMFLANLNVIFPNNTTKSFSECFYLLSDGNKNYFNEQLNNFKKSICLGCFNHINKNNNEFQNSIIYRCPCGCVLCNSQCLIRFLNAIPTHNMKSFICGCGVKYDYLQLKYFLYFTISMNFTKLKKDIMRFMYEIIKTKCCKCRKKIEILQNKKIYIHVLELIDHEAERILNIHKFNHLICDNCLNSNEMQKTKFYCNLCISEHSKVQELDFNNVQKINTCSIF